MYISGSATIGKQYLLASGGQDTELHLWVVEIGSQVLGGDTTPAITLHHTLCGHCAPIMSVRFSASGLLLASASGDKTVRLWDPVSFVSFSKCIKNTNMVQLCFIQKSIVYVYLWCLSIYNWWNKFSHHNFQNQYPIIHSYNFYNLIHPVFSKSPVINKISFILLPEAFSYSPSCRQPFCSVLLFSVHLSQSSNGAGTFLYVAACFAVAYNGNYI